MALVDVCCENFRFFSRNPNEMLSNIPHISHGHIANLPGFLPIAPSVPDINTYVSHLPYRTLRCLGQVTYCTCTGLLLSLTGFARYLYPSSTAACHDIPAPLWAHSCHTTYGDETVLYRYRFALVQVVYRSFCFAVQVLFRSCTGNARPT